MSDYRRGFDQILTGRTTNKTIANSTMYNSLLHMLVPTFH
jgi:hypothetical protein